MKLTVKHIVELLSQLDKRNEYSYINPTNRNKIWIQSINTDDSLKFLREAEEGSRKSISVTQPNLSKLVSFIRENVPFHIDSIMNASGSWRSIFESILAYTTEFYYCEINDKKHLVWIPSMPHTLGELASIDAGKIPYSPESDMFYTSIKDRFIAYMRSIGKAEKTITNYTSALEGFISKILQSQIGSQFTNIFDYTDISEVKDFQSKLLANMEFKLTNEAGKNMYSCAYNMYLSFLQTLNSAQVEPQATTLPAIEFSLSEIHSHIQKTGLIYTPDLLYRFAISLLTKRFVILSGLSGSGKTQLALAFAKWISEKPEEQIKMIAVGADWTNREYLLGYPDALKEGCYICPENNALEILIRAEENPDKPYFLILDEMNLSYVERYFADFLSAMESDEAILLHPEWENEVIPHQIKLPKNLFIIGTINVDETTYMFSPKVLDRANVIEFRVTNNEMESFLSSFNKIDKNAANGLGAHLAASFVKIAQRTIEEETADTLKKELAKFFNKLKIVSAEFGYRTATEIKRFYAIASSLETKWDDDDIMDKIIIQKLLPKLHGSRKKIVPVLEALWELCQKQSDDITKLDSEFSYDDFDSICKYPLSGEKIWRMYKNACENGFTSFAEA